MTSKYAKIHDVECVDLTTHKFSDQKKTIQRFDGSKKTVDVSRSHVIGVLENDNYKQLLELLSNKKFSPIRVQDDYSIDIYGDPINLRHTLAGKDGNVRKLSITMQNNYHRLLMDWTSEEIETHWDTIIENEPIGADDPPIDFTEISGDWDTSPNTGRDGSGDYSLKNYGTGNIYIGNFWLSDVSIDSWILFTILDVDAALIVRYNDEDNYYKLRINSSTGDLDFVKREGGTDMMMKTWSAVATLEVDTYYNFGIKAVGNRFEAWWGGILIGTVVDPDWTFITGAPGIRGERTSGFLNFDDITVEHLKPIILQFPVGAYDINAMLMYATTRLDDDITADGSIKLTLDPSKPIEFKQTADDPSGGEVKVWDTMGSDGDWDRLALHLQFNENAGVHTHDSSKNNIGITETNWDPANYAASHNGEAKSSYHFDGGDYLDLASNPDLTGDFTFLVWINTDTVDTDRIIMDFRDADNDGIFVWLEGATDKLNVYYNTADNTSGTAIITSTWYRFAFVVDRSANTLQMYLNGELYGTALDISGQTIDVTAALCIGSTSFGAASAQWDGYMDDVTILTTAWSADRIEWDYENAPDMVDETLWKRVFDPARLFVGNMVADNRKVRYSTNRLNSKNTVRMEAYTNGRWESIGYLFSWSSLPMVSVGREILLLDRYKVVIRETSFYRALPAVEMVWTDFTLTVGSPMINVENRRVL